VQGDDPRDLTRPRRQNVVEALAQERGLEDGPVRRARRGREQVLPAQRTYQLGDEQERDRGDQRPVVALLEGVPDVGRMDVPDRQVEEEGADAEAEPDQAVPCRAPVQSG
jgi:hypothetical protein